MLIRAGRFLFMHGFIYYNQYNEPRLTDKADPLAIAALVAGVLVVACIEHNTVIA